MEKTCFHLSTSYFLFGSDFELHQQLQIIKLKLIKLKLIDFNNFCSSLTIQADERVAVLLLVIKFHIHACHIYTCMSYIYMHVYSD